VRFSLLADPVDFFLDRERIETLKGQGEEETDSAVEHNEGVAKCPFNLFRRSRHQRRVRHTPMRGRRLTRPDGAHFLHGVVADRKNEVQLRRPGSGKFAPILAPQTLCRKMRDFELTQCLGSRRTGWTTARTIGRERRLTLPIS
jgi:hypothetical protein